MVFGSFTSSHVVVVLLGLLSLLQPLNSIRLGLVRLPSPDLPLFREAPAFRNGKECGSNESDRINVAMTLDVNYFRGTMAAVLSMLQHSTCPENLSFYFLSAHDAPELFSSIKSTFPYLNMTIYPFNSNRVRGKISKSIRQALDQPLNYARIYLADTIPENVQRVIYLDSDLVVVDDIAKLWGVDMEGKIVAAPEYCHANFTLYFTKQFWSDPCPVLYTLVAMHIQPTCILYGFKVYLYIISHPAYGVRVAHEVKASSFIGFPTSARTAQ